VVNLYTLLFLYLQEVQDPLVVLSAEDTFHHKLVVVVDLSDNPKEVELLSVDKAPYLRLHLYIPKLEVVDRPLQDNSHNKDLEDLSICHKHEGLLNLVDQSLVLTRQL